MRGRIGQWLARRREARADRDARSGDSPQRAAERAHEAPDHDPSVGDAANRASGSITAAGSSFNG